MKLILRGKYEYDVNINTAKYGNGRLAILLVGAAGELIIPASVNLPDLEMLKDEIAIKDYSENEGVLDFLVKNEIVEEPHRYASSGFVLIPICKLIRV